MKCSRYLSMSLLAVALWIGCHDGDRDPIFSTPDGRIPIVSGIYLTNEQGDYVGEWGEPESGWMTGLHKSVRGIDPPPPSFSLKLHPGYPMPTENSFTIRFDLNQMSRVSMWIVRGTSSPDLGEPPALAGTSLLHVVSSCRTIVESSLFSAGNRSYEIRADDVHHPLDTGLYRVYVQADDNLVWQDIWISPCDELPSDVRRAIQCD